MSDAMRGLALALLAGVQLALVLGTPPAGAQAPTTVPRPSEAEFSWRRAATFVDKILKGARPADLPVEQPSAFDLVINLNAAKTLGLALPQTLVIQATHVIP